MKELLGPIRIIKGSQPGSGSGMIVEDPGTLLIAADSKCQMNLWTGSVLHSACKSTEERLIVAASLSSGGGPSVHLST